jgi:hypothetical protein
LLPEPNKKKELFGDYLGAIGARIGANKSRIL